MCFSKFRLSSIGEFIARTCCPILCTRCILFARGESFNSGNIGFITLPSIGTRMASNPYVSIRASTKCERALWCIFCGSRFETADSIKLHEPAMACSLLDVRQVYILPKITLALGILFPRPIFRERRDGKLTTRRQLQYSDHSHNLNRLMPETTLRSQFPQLHQIVPKD